MCRSACNEGDLVLIPELGRSLGGGHDNTLQCFCLENPQEQRSLEGFSPWGCKESDTTGWLSTQHTQIFRSTIIGSRGECVILLFSCVWLFATLTLCNPMDCSLPGSFVHEISQARILEWVAISFSRGSSWSRDWTQVSCIARWILYHWVTRKGQCVLNFIKKCENIFYNVLILFFFFFLDQQYSRIPGASQP